MLHDKIKIRISNFMSRLFFRFGIDLHSIFLKKKLINKIILNVLLIVITIIFTNSTYHFGNINHIEQLPHVFSKLNTNYLEKDSFVQYTKEINPRYYYSQIIMFSTKLVPLEISFYVLTLIFNYCILIITYLAMQLFHTNTLSIILSTMFMFTYKFGNLGGAGAINDSYLVPQLMATPLVLLAFIASITGSFITIVICLLLSLMIQPSLTLLFFIPISGNILLNKMISKRYIKISILFLSLICFTFFLFPNNTSHLLESKYLIYILAYLRHPHHYIPSQFSPTLYKEFIILIIGFFISLAYLYKNKNLKNPVKSFFLSGILSLLLMLAGYIFVELIPIKPIVELQTFRIVSLFRWMSLVVIFSALYIFLKQKFKLLFINIIYILLIICFIFQYFSQNRLLITPNISQVIEINKLNLYKYISEKTSSDAVFLSPPNFGDMRIIPKRAIVSDWKSFPFNEKNMDEWYKRIIDCYGEENLDKNYLNMNDDKLKTLENTYHFNYAILNIETKTELNVIYSDAFYKLIKI